MRLPSAEQIRQRLMQGCSYAEAIDGDFTDDNVQYFNKYKPFKVKTVMAEEVPDNKTDKISVENLTKENFRWRTADKEYALDEMDADFKLSALIHALNKANENHAKYTKYEKARNVCYKNTEYFVKITELLEESLLEDHGVQVPSKIEDVASMRRMIKEGIVKVDKFEAPNERKNDS